MIFVKFVTIMTLVLLTMQILFTSVMVAYGYLSIDWLLVQVLPYIFVCCISVWGLD